MKKLIAIIPVIAIMMMSANVYAGGGVDPETPAGSDDTKLNLWIPGFLVKMAAEIADDHVTGEDEAAVDLLRKFGSATICIREGDSYTEKTDKKITRKLDRMERKNYEALISVNSDGETVNISIKENKRGKIKRMVILVDEQDETFVYLKLNCRLDMDDVATVCKEYVQ
jgi:hypothetical protein